MKFLKIWFVALLTTLFLFIFSPLLFLDILLTRVHGRKPIVFIIFDWASGKPISIKGETSAVPPPPFAFEPHYHDLRKKSAMYFLWWNKSKYWPEMVKDGHEDEVMNMYAKMMESWEEFRKALCLPDPVNFMVHPDSLRTLK